MKAFLLPVSIVALALVGCGDPSSKSGQSTNAASGGNPVTAPVDYLGAISKGEQSAIKTIDTTSISKAIQLFQVDKGRLPNDLNELVQEKYLPRIPETPYGTKLDYNPATGQIKVVKQ
jgi:hypothetical protein